jgi:hypothetical protein
MYLAWTSARPSGFRAEISNRLLLQARRQQQDGRPGQQWRQILDQTTWVQRMSRQRARSQRALARTWLRLRW